MRGLVWLGVSALVWLGLYALAVYVSVWLVLALLVVALVWTGWMLDNAPTMEEEE